MVQVDEVAGRGEGDMIVGGADYLVDMWDPNVRRDVKEILASVPTGADVDFVYFLESLDAFYDRNVEEEQEEEGEAEVDPQFKLWLDGVEGYRNAYVLQVTNYDRKTMRLVYEYEEEEEEGSSGKKRKGRKGSCVGIGGDVKRKPEEGKLGKGNRGRMGSRVLGKLSGEKKSDRHLKPGLGVKASCEGRVGVGGRDELYVKVLDNLKMEGEVMVLVFDDGKQVRYEEDDHGEKPSSSRKQTSKADTSTLSDKKAEEDFVWQDDLDDAHLPFRERVMNRFRNPYDSKEHKYLMELVQLQKPVVYYRETRAGKLTPYTQPGHVGKSYLEHEPELYELIQKVESNDYKVLNVLRGFFFWLKHLANDGAFKPWMDKSCKAAIRYS